MTQFFWRPPHAAEEKIRPTPLSEENRQPLKVLADPPTRVAGVFWPKPQASENIRNSRISNISPMNLKPKDLLVLLKVAAHPPQRWTYAVLGEALSMSASEARGGVRPGGGARARRVVAGSAQPARIHGARRALHLASHPGAGQAWRAHGLRRRATGQPAGGGPGRGARVGTPHRQRQGPHPLAAVPHGPPGRLGRPGLAPPAGAAGCLARGVRTPSAVWQPRCWTRN